MVDNLFHVKDLSDFKEHLANAGSKLVIVDFFATWCGPCKVIGPKFVEFAGEHVDSIFLKVDVDECEDIAQEYNINSMPTFVFIMNQKEVGRFSGANADKLLNEIISHKSKN